MWGRSLTKLARLIARSRRQHLIDTPPVHIDDLEPPTQQFYGLPGLREMVHLPDHESCNRFVVAVLGSFMPSCSAISSAGIQPASSHEPSSR